MAKISALYFVLAAVVVSGCASTLAPQAARSIATDKMANQGAMADASRAYRVAFYADPGALPEFMEVTAGLGGTKVLVSQWTTELARLLNRLIAKLGLYDERFQELGQEVFNYEVETGDIIYKWRAPAGGPKFGRTRVATLAIKELTTSTGGEGIVGSAVLEVTMPGWVHLYACEQGGGDNWMTVTMACLGERILGDPSFWKAVEALP